MDYVVCMRRFPPGALLSETLQDGQLQGADLAPFAARLARFHAQAQRAPRGSPCGAPAQVRGAVEAVLDQLEPFYCAATVASLRAWVEAESDALAPHWDERIRNGHVRECHGDLHLDNLVWINGGVTAFDCVEFDASLRTIDTVCDTAFTTMDLKARGQADLAHGFLDDYLQASGDYAGVPLLRFYEVYRALVRALADALRRACGASAAPGTPYLAWASKAICTSRAVPPLVLMHGLSGSGKSTVARQIALQGGAIRLRSDVERKRMFGLDANAASADAGLDLYRQDCTERTYDHLRLLACQLLASGHATVVDAAFLQRGQREAFRALAAALHAPFTILHCDAPERVLRERLRGRAVAGADPSEADTDVLDQQMARQDPLAPSEQAHAVVVPYALPWAAADLWRQIARERDPRSA